MSPDGGALLSQMGRHWLGGTSSLALLTTGTTAPVFLFCCLNPAPGGSVGAWQLMEQKGTWIAHPWASFSQGPGCLCKSGCLERSPLLPSLQGWAGLLPLGDNTHQLCSSLPLPAVSLEGSGIFPRP